MGVFLLGTAALRIFLRAWEVILDVLRLWGKPRGAILHGGQVIPLCHLEADVSSLLVDVRMFQNEMQNDWLWLYNAAFHRIRLTSFEYNVGLTPGAFKLGYS